MSTDIVDGAQHTLTDRSGVEVRWIMPEGFLELPFEADDLRVVPQMIFGSPRVWGRPLCGPPVYPVRARL
ncbi:hypothetical protein ACIP87_30740, partial [Streptomyces albidoflavus]